MLAQLRSAAGRAGTRLSSKPRTALLATCVAVVFPLALSCDRLAGADTERELLVAYLQAADKIDETWQRGVEAAYDGREYLAYGGNPPDDRSTALVLRDVETNLRMLIEATQSAIASAQELDPPRVAEDFHEQWTSTLSDLVRVWMLGLDPLSERDYDGFVVNYERVQAEREMLNARLAALQDQRQLLGERAVSR